MKKVATKTKPGFQKPAMSASVGGASDAYFAQAIGKAFRCLEIIRRSPDALSLTDVNARIGGAKSSVFRVLHTLEALGYVERDAAGRYRAAGARCGLDRAPYLLPLLRSAEPKLKELLSEFDETASVASLFENHIEVVAVLESSQIIRMANLKGRILPPHASSLGKSVAAFQPEDRQDRLLRTYGVHRYTHHTLTSVEDLKREFLRIRESGWATDAEENTIGGLCFGAPIFAGGPHAVGAISISAPKMRIGNGIRERMLAEVRRCALEISSELASS